MVLSIKKFREVRGERFSSNFLPRPTLREPKVGRGRRNRGQLLVEILLAISVTAIVVALGAQMTFVSLKSNRLTGERDVATALTREELEAVRAIAHDDWATFYGGTGSSTPNYTSEDTTLGRWKFLAGIETTTTDLTIFYRYFSVASTSRTSTDIDSVYNPAYDDPSTKLVSVSVSWPSGGATTTEYISRWRNRACYQTDWSGGGTTPTDNANTACTTVPPTPITPTTGYFSADAAIKYSTPGQLELQ